MNEWTAEYRIRPHRDNDKKYYRTANKFPFFMIIDFACLWVQRLRTSQFYESSPSVSCKPAQPWTVHTVHKQNDWS